MPRKDHIHSSVKNALIKEDWTITHDPLFIEYGQEDMYVDLGAERLLAAEHGTEKIAVEIKSFVGTSTLTELHNALGQHQVYLAGSGDDIHGQYVVMRVGWRAETRVHRPAFYLRLKDDKIHVEDDWTKEGIANELMRAGILLTHLLRFICYVQ